MNDLKIGEICYVSLNELGTWIGGGTPSKAIPAYWENGTIPWVSPKDMKVDHIRSAEDLITEEAVKESATNLLPAGAVLVVTRSGILRHTFPVAVADVPVTVNQDLKALVPKSEIDPEYVAFALRAFGREILNQCSKQGTTVNSIETKELLRFQIPLFSFNEQTRIVAEIEKQFSRLDEAVANLKRVKANLKRYKAAVLKAAVEGKLTEEWRRQHPDVEPADKLLARILAERRKSAGKGKYKEPAVPETTNLPELSEGWVWTSVEQLVAHVTDGDHQAPPQTDQGIPFLVIGNVRSGQIDFTDTRFVGETYYKSLDPKRQPRQGDLLYTLVGSYGIPVSVITDNPFCIQRHMAILRPHEKSPMDYLVLAMNSDNVFKQATAVATGTAQMTVPLAGLRKISIPLPPLAEQHQIVAEVERRLSIVAGAEAQVDANLRRADRLRQSILKQAFSGQLVPQDPNDEPASVLLERIRNGVGAIHESPARATRKPKRAIHESPLRKPRPQTEPTPTASDKFACLDDVTAAILGRMQPGREYARVDLADVLGLTTSRWNVAIQDLKRIGKVRQTGEKRGARYLRLK